MTTPKKAANLTVRSDLLDEARARKINLSQTLETALAAELKKRQIGRASCRERV